MLTLVCSLLHHGRAFLLAASLSALSPGNATHSRPEVCTLIAGGKQMREQLTYTILDLLGTPLGQWLCSNDSTAVHAAQSSSALSATAAHALESAFVTQNAQEGNSTPFSASWLHMRQAGDLGNGQGASDEGPASQSWYQVRVMATFGHAHLLPRRTLMLSRG